MCYNIVVYENILFVSPHYSRLRCRNILLSSYVRSKDSLNKIILSYILWSWRQWTVYKMTTATQQLRFVSVRWTTSSFLTIHTTTTLRTTVTRFVQQSSTCVWGTFPCGKQWLSLFQYIAANHSHLNTEKVIRKRTQQKTSVSRYSWFQQHNISEVRQQSNVKDTVHQTAVVVVVFKNITVNSNLLRDCGFRAGSLIRGLLATCGPRCFLEIFKLMLLSLLIGV